MSLNLKKLTHEQRLKLLRAGGGMQLDIEAESFTQLQLVQYAEAAAVGKATLRLANYGKGTFDQAISIAKAGEGHVFFCD